MHQLALTSLLMAALYLYAQTARGLEYQWGDLEPNQRPVDARGDFSAHLFDDGNLNYDKGGIYTALVKVNADFNKSQPEYAVPAGHGTAHQGH